MSLHEPTDIEKKNLEAHVELCAERYKFLESKLITVEEKVEEITNVINDVRDTVHKMAEKRSDQLIGWGISIIIGLLAIIGWFITQYIIKI